MVLMELEVAQSSLEQRPGDPLEKQQSKWQATYCKVTRRIFIIAFFFLLPAQAGVLQTATMKTAGNARQREEMDLAHNRQ